MTRKKWDSKTKWLIVLEGIKGRAVTDICTDHGISQSMYYQWRDQFLLRGHEIFDEAKEGQKRQRLERENSRLKNLIGELTLEFKKNDYFLE